MTIAIDNARTLSIAANEAGALANKLQTSQAHFQAAQAHQAAASAGVVAGVFVTDHLSHITTHQNSAVSLKALGR
jgi:hypothetical protein